MLNSIFNLDVVSNAQHETTYTFINLTHTQLIWWKDELIPLDALILTATTVNKIKLQYQLS